MNRRTVRIAVLTGITGSLIVFGLVLGVHNHLYSKHLGRAQATMDTIRGRLEATPTTTRTRTVRGGGDVLELALAKPPAVLSERDRALLEPATPFYTDAERRAYVTARVKGALDAHSDLDTLAPPGDVQASYADGAVTLAWDTGPANRVLASALAARASPLRLAFRVYRRRPGEDLAPQVTLPFGVTSWKDRSLPIARSTLYYEVWTVLLKEAGEGAAPDASPTETLVSAERGDLVTLSVPEHFTLELVGGDETRAEFLAVVGTPEAPVATAVVSAGLGEIVSIGELSTGLTVQQIEMRSVDTLENRQRLSLTTDGAVAIDPATGQPRYTQTQVLVPGLRMRTVLVHEDGETRTLEADLP
jgi:hypothetical protein